MTGSSLGRQRERVTPFSMGTTHPATRPARIDRGTLARIGVVTALVVVGAVVNPPPHSSSHNQGFQIGYHAGGAVFTFLILLLIGTVAFLFRRRTNRSRPWSSTTFSAAPMIITLGVVVALGANRFASHHAALEYAKSSSSKTSQQPEQAQKDAAGWLASLDPIRRHRDAWLADHNVMRSILETAGNTPLARAKAAEARTELVQMLAIARGVPDAPEEDLNRARDELVKLMQVRLVGYNLYVKALELNAQKGAPIANDHEAQLLLDQGDATFDRARVLSDRLGPRLTKLAVKYRTPGR
jgi:hypothetical protein